MPSMVRFKTMSSAYPHRVYDARGGEEDRWRAAACVRYPGRVMPFRSFAGSWRRMSAVVVLALAMIIAPQATELCAAACARAAAATMVMPSAQTPAAEAGH